MKKITHSEQETIELGKKLASELKGGEVICLYGNLGAGKTTLIKGIARGLGVKKVVTSPTFILMNIYQINSKSQVPNSNLLSPGGRGWVRGKIQNFVHIDCYRINKAEDIENIGATEYFCNPNSIVVIEWPERILEILPKKRMEIKIEMSGENEREIEIINC